MTTSPNPDDPDTEGKTVPPYDGRRETADVDGPETSVRDGVGTGGATGPVDSDADVDDPSSTPRGEHASPAEEEPPEEASDTDTEPDLTGPAHEPGTGRAEDQP